MIIPIQVMLYTIELVVNLFIPIIRNIFFVFIKPAITVTVTHKNYIKSYFLT